MWTRKRTGQDVMKMSTRKKRMFTQTRSGTVSVLASGSSNCSAVLCFVLFCFDLKAQLIYQPVGAVQVFHS